MDLSSFYNQFREETTENVRVLGAGLMAIESLSDEAARRAELDRVFRAVHTIKGSARMLGFEVVGRLAHALENVLSELRQGRRILDSSLANQLLRAGDSLLVLSVAVVEGRPVDLDVDGLIAEIAGAVGDFPTPPEVASSYGETPAPIEPPRRGVYDPHRGGSTGDVPHAPARAPVRQTVRVRVDRLDKMLNLAGELVVGGQVFANHSEQLQVARQFIARQQRAVQALEDELARLRFSPRQRQALDQRISTVRDSSDRLNDLILSQVDLFSRQVGQQDLLVKDLEQEVMAARLVPVATLYSGLPRAVRDLGQATGKDLRLELRGEGVEIDRKVLELINDPLLHLLRNAADHGIETPAERTAAGKSATGLIEVSAEATGGEVRLSVRDDGRGLDPQRLRERAVRSGLISAEQAGRLSDVEALDLIFAAGFSTAAIVTDISGRGVGMDVVRSNISELGGQIVVDSQPGQGTRFTLVLPLTLLTTRIILVRLGSSTFALPASGCEGTLWIYRKLLHTIEGQPALDLAGRTLMVIGMAELLGMDADEPFQRAERAPAMLIGSGQRQVAILVDELLDEREAVVKPLGPIMAARRAFSGAVQLGDGSLILLLNPMWLVQSARSVSAARPTTPLQQRPRRRRRLLVIDDSFTTRELIRSILQSAGYEVQAAVDGADALDKLRAQPYDLIVSDVEMPRVDGFQLTTRIRGDLGLHDLPVVLITSLASEEHRRRGLEAGAQAYIVKSQFNQDGLLEVIQQLLGHEL